MKKVVRAAIQEELERFFAQVQELSEGDLEHLEEQVVKTSQQMGRSLLEGLLNSRLREQRPVARRQESCGHRQRLAGERPKHLLSLVGPISFVRPYYQCLAVSEADASCTHGEAPDDGVSVDTPAADSVRYVARRTAKGGFDWLLYQLARQGGLEQANQVVVVGDGAPWIWNLAAEHFPGAVQILDLSHAKEHVWDVAHAVFGRGTPSARVWAAHACSLLEQGQSEALVSAISALPPIPPEPGQARSCPEQAVDYFTSNAARMRYPVFRAQGMHVGSGIAEAACKTIVSTRAKRSEMRWTPEGIDALLP